MNDKVPVLACKGLSKTFVDGSIQVNVLSQINFQIARGEKVAILGSSGAGKSTLLHLLGGLDTPSEGQVQVLGKDIYQVSEQERCFLRNQALGFVYQFHHLLPEFTVLENVCMPLLIRGSKPAFAIQQSTDVLNKVGLSHRLEHKLGQLSGGERQRTAIARAMVTKPACLLADEPTGNLDHATADKVYNMLIDLNHEYGMSLIVVTHDLRLTKSVDRVLYMEDGKLLQR